MTIYGYARVSSRSQSLDVQIQALTDHGCEVIFEEKISGLSLERPKFQELLDQLNHDDVLVVTKLDRFARSTRDALSTIEHLNKRGVALVVLNMGGDTVNTSTPVGKLMITILSGVAEFEVGMIKERQLEGIAEAKKRGVYKGRPQTYTANHEGLNHALSLYENRNENGFTVKRICKITNVSRATLYRAMQERSKE